MPHFDEKEYVYNAQTLTYVHLNRTKTAHKSMKNFAKSCILQQTENRLFSIYCCKELLLWVGAAVRNNACRLVGSFQTPLEITVMKNKVLSNTENLTRKNRRQQLRRRSICNTVSVVRARRCTDDWRSVLGMSTTCSSSSWQTLQSQVTTLCHFTSSNYCHHYTVASHRQA